MKKLKQKIFSSWPACPECNEWVQDLETYKNPYGALNSRFQISWSDRKKMNILFASLLICFFAYLFIGLPAHADVSLGVYPPILQINTTPPADITSPFVVSNETNAPLDVQVMLRPFAPLNHEGQIRLIPPSEGVPGNDPLILQKAEIVDSTGNKVTSLSFGPQEEKKLQLHIPLLKDEPPSDYYFTILFLSKSIEQNKESSSAISGGIGINVLLSIGPFTTTTGSIKAFSSPWIVDHGPLPFSVDIQNDSSHFVSPKGVILVKNMFGQTIGKVSLLQENILAHNDRYLLSNDSIDTTHALWNEVFLLGPYSATLTIALSDQGPLFTRTIYFFAMPIQVLLGTLIIVGLVVITVVRVRKRLQEKD